MRLTTTLLLLLAPAAAAQTTIQVPGDAATIQAGIDAASDGDTVLVAAGTYDVNELTTRGKAIRLRSSDGPEATILDGRNVVRIMRFDSGEGPDTVVQGFTFLDGKAPDATGGFTNELDGGAIRMFFEESPTIRDCIFIGNRAGKGRTGTTGGNGAAGPNDGDDGENGDNGFTGGRGGRGGAIYAGFGDPTIDACIFFNNRAGDGGRGGTGGKGGKGGPSGFLECPGDGGNGGKGGRGGVGGSGGAIGIVSGQMTIANCLFIDSRAGRGGPGGSGGSGGAGGDSGLICQDGDPGSNGSGGNGGNGGNGGTLWIGESLGGTDGVIVMVNSAVTGSDVGDPGTPLTGTAFGLGAVLFQPGDSFRGRNSIFWGNEPTIPSFQTNIGSTIGANLRFCNTQVSMFGLGNFSSDPLWNTNADPVWSGYQLGALSPCIDAGSSEEWFSAPGSQSKIFDLTRHYRAIDMPLVADAVAGSELPAIDVGPYEVVAPAVSEIFSGCGVNPAGSLSIVSGEATLGSTITIGIDNPIGTQAPGSLAYFSLSLGTQNLTPCGLIVPGFGMQGNGAAGEFLLSYEPGVLLLDAFAGVWNGPGQPVLADIAVSSNPSVLGLEFFVQGALIDLTPGAIALYGLTNGLRFVHGD